MYDALLKKGLAQLGLELSSDKIDQLLAYHALLVKWNKAYNLTAVRDPQEMIGRHLLDSLSIIPHIEGDTVLDVGTGPGLPGIPMSICFPERRFTLLDSNGKKTRFLTQSKIELGLSNMTPVQSRIESFQHELFDAITSRAFATLKDMVDGSIHLLKRGGFFYAMKGVYPEGEIEQLDERVSVVDCFVLHVPGEDGERHLVKIIKN
ncbi:16S rRNA (guanine(527)-N(7))-methyltransferase RsmG [Bermanella sp. R86510]|uniref:16S rRNA (guanine(527)-N(7))-methyltransferase RsmG n=1 Tax=unclassified Bermanella TaxID=2627862 RepID=UPI0037CB7FA8